MKRALLLSLGWLFTAITLYVLLALLEVYWNLLDWSPRWDYLSLALLSVALLLQVVPWLLARATREKWPRRIAGTICLGLCAIGLFCAWPEHLTEGLLGRQTVSPDWYRWGRFGVLSIPGLWVCGYTFRARPKVPSASPKVPEPGEPRP